MNTSLLVLLIYLAALSYFNLMRTLKSKRRSLRLIGIILNVIGFIACIIATFIAARV